MGLPTVITHPYIIQIPLNSGSNVENGLLALCTRSLHNRSLSCSKCSLCEVKLSLM